MSQGRKPGDETSRRDLEDLAEDAVGVNFRSLRTMRDLVIRPNTVFRAYAANDRETYTPALRIWLALISVSFVISLLFGGHEQLLLNVFANQPDLAARVSTVTGGDLAEVAEDFSDRFGALQPIAVALLTSLTIFLVALFDKGLRWQARLNITFATLTVGTLVGLALYPVSINYPQLGMAGIPPVWLAYMLTVFRGSPGVLGEHALWRGLKAALFATATLILVMIAGIVSMGLSLTHAIEVNAVAPVESETPPAETQSDE